METTFKATEKFYNQNGRTYTILATTNFNAVDREYYKNSWQKCYVALLQSDLTGEYVVATLLGDTEWGSGYYADGIKDAVAQYTKVTEEYLARG